MKKICILTLTICSFEFASSQNHLQGNDSVRHHRHELGLDATSFIKQFLSFNNQTQGYVPRYYLTYRYHFKHSNLRAAAGGTYKNENVKSPNISNPNRARDFEKSFDFRIGYEFTKTLNGRWSAFYGLDLRPSVSHIKNDDIGQTSGYTRGFKSDSRMIGLAPLLGFKYKINHRLSLTAEASISFNYFEEFSHYYYTPNADWMTARPDDNKRDSYNWYSSFNQPIFIIIVFDL